MGFIDGGFHICYSDGISIGHSLCGNRWVNSIPAEFFSVLDWLILCNIQFLYFCRNTSILILLYNNGFLVITVKVKFFFVVILYWQTSTSALFFEKLFNIGYCWINYGYFSPFTAVQIMIVVQSENVDALKFSSWTHRNGITSSCFHTVGEFWIIM